MRNRSGTIITIIFDIKRILKYQEQLCAHKSDNLDIIGQFPEKHNLSKLTQKEIT